MVCEFGEELDVEEEDGGVDEFTANDVEEDLGAVVFVGFGGALGGFEGFEAEVEEGEAVGEEECLFACFYGLISILAFGGYGEGGDMYLFLAGQKRTHQHHSPPHP